MAKKLKSDSLFEITFVSDPQLSPDRRKVVAVQTVIETPDDGKKKDKDGAPRYRSQLFLYDVGGGEPQQLTFAAGKQTTPRFSPDGGRIAFLSTRSSEKPQLFVLPLRGGEAEQLTEHALGVSEFVWHPEGTEIAYVSRGDETPETFERGRTVSRMFYKQDGIGFRPDEVGQVYGLELSSRKQKKLTTLACTPSGLAYSPDGKALYFSAADSVEVEDSWRGSLWRLSLKNGKLKEIAGGLLRPSMPTPSPDGQTLAFVSSADQDNFAAPNALWRVVVRSGDVARISGPDDLLGSEVGGDSRYGAYPQRPVWSETGDTVYTLLNREGRSMVAAVFVESGEVAPLLQGDRAVTGFSYAQGTTVFTAETPDQPGELFVRDESGAERQLSRVNRDFVNKYRLAIPSATLYARAEGGPEVGYWRLEPDKSRKDNALVLQVHGGPHTNYGYGFYFEFQLLASAGYTVVYGNPRGSSGYGNDFATAVQGNYGGLDADDVMAIAMAARQEHDDSEAPMHLTGGSYGGFMTNWLVGQTDSFRSAVTQRSICNWLSFYGTSDIGYNFAALEVRGNPWTDTELLWQQSPIRHVDKVTTPLLIVHSEEDHRCPVEQAEQFYIALKALGKAPTKLLRFPGEGHELSRSGRPDRRVARLEALLGWFKEHA
ncbi:MAG: S9 family peptidase [Trueperaceae bacterium]|nr:S9 family peptidase [Trueperaceae bacterium]